MGFFDRLAAKKASSAPSSAPLEQAPGSTPPMGTPSSAVLPKLAAAREKLDAKDIGGAMAIYEDLLATAGDRPDVLVTLSGDLGSCGYVAQIVELVAPRYDALRHGPATGINLLQAYLATHNTTAAQHLLDILFALQRPELEQRLYGFSNALAEMIEAEKRGQLPAAESSTPDEAPADGSPQKSMVTLASISKPIWYYGLEPLADLVLPAKEPKLRRVTFAQLALVNMPQVIEKMGQPEEAMGRLSRAIPLWFTETLYLAPHYQPNTAVAVAAKHHFGLVGGEWTTDHLRQLVDTTDGGIDYVFTGSLQEKSSDFDLVMKVWEIKKFRERKVFTARWTPATADAELAKLHEQIRLFMEWAAYPAGTGPVYKPTARPTAWLDVLGASLSLFFGEKEVLPRDQLAVGPETFAHAAELAPTSETASLAWLTLRHRAALLGLAVPPEPQPTLVSSPLVDEARALLGG
jgi:hypothetical protein